MIALSRWPAGFAAGRIQRPLVVVRSSVACVWAVVAWSCASAPSGAPASQGPWKLAWSDEFAGPAGTTFDRTKWAPDTGGSGWGNQEREFYTTRPDNIALDGAGHLVITARAEDSTRYACWYGGCRYSSARIKSAGLF